MSLEVNPGLDLGAANIRTTEGVKAVQRRLARDNSGDLGPQAAIILDSVPALVTGGDLTRVLNFAASLARSGHSRDLIIKGGKS